MEKMCPYNCAREVQHYELRNDIDSDGMVTGTQSVLRCDYIPLPCPGEQCGAWRDGACCYGVPPGARGER